MGSILTIKGARANNLKSVDIEIPHGVLAVFTGVSGSGKSSLAYDTIFREGQRRYLESISSYARQFLGKLERPPVDQICGLGPSLSIDQSAFTSNPRSTVGTLSDVYDYLRLLYARLGTCEADIKINRSLFSFNSQHGACPHCKGLGIEDRVDPKLLIADPAKTIREGAFVPTTPSGYIVYSQVTMDVLDQVCRANGFDVETPWQDLTEEQQNVVYYGSDKIKIPFGKHTLESRMKWNGITAKPREEGFYKGIVSTIEDILKSKRNKNILRFVASQECSACNGSRLRKEAHLVKFNDKSISDLSGMSVSQLREWFGGVDNTQNQIGEQIFESIDNRLSLLNDLGLGYLTLSRSSATLSSGESQRIKLASQISSSLNGVLYVLDEPSIGLHSKDSDRLLEVLKEIRDKGNTLIVVEHDENTIRNSDWIVDIGPKAGIDGGEILFCGESKDFFSKPVDRSVTRRFLLNENQFGSETKRKGSHDLTVKGARLFNLKNIDVTFKQNAFNVVTGVSGAGKSTLVNQVLAEGKPKKNSCDAIEGMQHIKNIINIDQKPIGRTPRSNPATYTKLFDHIRDLFSAETMSKERGWSKGRFSFNVKGGRCEACEGGGAQSIGMHFLGDVTAKCDVCNGRRFNEETLEIRVKGKNIYEVLEMSVDEGFDFFKDHKKIHKILTALKEIGLGYITLGQPSTTLSGGEAQRVKLAAELARSRAKTLYILDEPTTGLHPADIKILLKSLNGLIDAGGTVIVVEHDLDTIRSADWVVDLGPDSGEQGGSLVATGTADEIMDVEASHTGRALKRNSPKIAAREISKLKRSDIELRGVSTHNLKNIDVTIPANKLTTITGVSGSGKSSLAFDTIFAEGQRRFAENLSTYARNYMKQLAKPAFDSSKGISPSIAIGQRSSKASPRSTVGTATGIYDLLRLVFSRIGEGRKDFTARHFSFNHHLGACDNCRGLGSIITADPERLITHPDRSILDGAMSGSKTGRFYGDPDGQYVAVLKTVGPALDLDFAPSWESLDEKAKQIAMFGCGEETFDVTWSYKRKTRTGEHQFSTDWPGFTAHVDKEYQRKHADKRAEGLLPLMKEVVCPHCKGKRLKSEILAVTINGKSISDLCNLGATELKALLTSFSPTDHEQSAVLKRTADIVERLSNLEDAGLGYLSLNRSVTTLSGGENRRLAIASQIGSDLCGVTYVLDEPTTGLHTYDTKRLISLLHKIRDLGNTVIAVEHDGDVITASDHIIDLGPGAANEGGEIVASGDIKEIIGCKQSVTAPFLDNPGLIPLPTKRRPASSFLKVTGACANNLKNISVDIPVGCITTVTGISGSGKSSLVFDTLVESIQKQRSVKCGNIDGHQIFDRVVCVDQSPIGLTPSSVPATYSGVMDDIRRLFAGDSLSKSLFSFNSKAGACETCRGLGAIKTSMDFLSDAWIECETCQGKRYNTEALKHRYNDLSIFDVLSLSITEARAAFAGDKRLSKKLALLIEVGLGYLCLGQSATTLSGGEAQRLKLATELIKAPTNQKNCLYVFDEPTTGLHFIDTAKLIALFDKLASGGSTVVAVEHNLDVIKCSDWLIDLGPEGGGNGGSLVSKGTPETVISEISHTAKALAEHLKLHK